MFKHILLPTDGSELSEAAIQKGIQFAKSINAKVTGFHVILPFHVFTLQMERLGDTKEQYERQSKGQAEQFLGVIKKAAEKGGCEL
jgi:nucleotide-binding universal stress UspA family protein